MKLVAEMESVRGTPSVDEAAGPLFKARASQKMPPASKDRSRRLVRTVVATTAKTEAFGWRVSAEAMRRGFYASAVKAVVGDGGNWIGPLGEMHFPGWIQMRRVHNQPGLVHLLDVA